MMGVHRPDHLLETYKHRPHIDVLARKTPIQDSLSAVAFGWQKSGLIYPCRLHLAAHLLCADHDNFLQSLHITAAD